MIISCGVSPHRRNKITYCSHITKEKMQSYKARLGFFNRSESLKLTLLQLITDQGSLGWGRLPGQQQGAQFAHRKFW